MMAFSFIEMHNCSLVRKQKTSQPLHTIVCNKGSSCHSYTVPKNVRCCFAHPIIICGGAGVLPMDEKMMKRLSSCSGIQKVDMRPEGLQQLPWKLNTELAADLFNSIFN